GYKNQGSLEDAPGLPGVWQTVRDCVAGEAAIKGKLHTGVTAGGIRKGVTGDRTDTHLGQANGYAERYLPRDGGFAEEAPNGDKLWASYLKRASYYTAPGHTLNMLLGMASRQSVTIEAPDSLADTVEGRVAHGIPLTELIWDGLADVLSVGRFGVLVDLPGEAQVNASPYFCHYEAEDIVSWRLSWIDGALRPVYVRLSEPLREGDKEGAARFLDLILENGEYRQEQVLKIGDSEIAELVEVRVNGQPIDFIPFVAGNSFGVGMHLQTKRVMQPAPLFDLSLLAIKHYQVGADLYHHLHRSSLSQVVLTGVAAEDESAPSSYGEAKAWFLPANADAKVISAPPSSYESSAREREALEARMAATGAQLIHTDRSPQETAEAARMRKGAETSTLVRSVRVVESVYRRALRFAAVLRGSEPDETSLDLPTGFIERTMQPAELQAHVMAWQSGMFGDPRGEIAADINYGRLSAGNVLPDSLSLEAYRAATVNFQERPELLPEVSAA
ncbi:MAG: DUF4055 domain-containing protein, partial [Planctomycetota bacterium]